MGGFIMMAAPFMGLSSWLTVLWVTALFVLLVASVIDFRHYVIPDGATMTLVVLGVLMTALEYLGLTGQISVIQGSFLGGYAYIFSFTQNVILGHVVAAAALGLIFSLIILLSRGKSMGWGDAKLAAAVGLMLGWPDAILAIMMAFIIGAMAGVSLMVMRMKKMKDALPFGPFISIGVAMAVYFGYEIMVAYFRFLNLGV
jgi:leader peptidase (prepilin peptidase)/N-methyltransferase